MAAGVIRSFLVHAPAHAYLPLIFQQSPCREEKQEGKPEEKPEAREDEDEREEEEEEDEESEAQEEDEEEGLEEVFLNPSYSALDVTKQLLKFADLISRDVRRYFGHSSVDQEACDIYNDSISVTSSGRLRYYDDLLRLARAGSPGEQDDNFVACVTDRQAVVAEGNNSLGPLAELFELRGPNQGRSRPMIKRQLPHSFWMEPIPCCSLVSFTNTPEVSDTNTDAPLQDSTHTHTDTDTHMHYSPLPHQHTHALDSSQPDFSDLLANWDPNLDLAHTLTENTHMQH